MVWKSAVIKWLSLCHHSVWMVYLEVSVFQSLFQNWHNFDTTLAHVKYHSAQWNSVFAQTSLGFSCCYWNPLEENMRDSLKVRAMDMSFLSRSPVVQQIVVKINKWDYIEFLFKVIHNKQNSRVKSIQNRTKNSTSGTWARELRVRMQKPAKTTNTPNNRQMKWTALKKHKRLINIIFNIQHHNPSLRCKLRSLWDCISSQTKWL